MTTNIQQNRAIRGLESDEESDEELLNETDQNNIDIAVPREEDDGCDIPVDEPTVLQSPSTEDTQSGDSSNDESTKMPRRSNQIPQAPKWQQNNDFVLYQ